MCTKGLRLVHAAGSRFIMGLAGLTPEGSSAHRDGAASCHGLVFGVRLALGLQVALTKSSP